mmetsp:Transcript_11525/g.28211  ORF Transcript_11525/g.28211 Transcript_11525/m.28211 type:complete len:87 (+) Transcript_11525:1142-1402(+)
MPLDVQALQGAAGSQGLQQAGAGGSVNAQVQRGEGGTTRRSHLPHSCCEITRGVLCVTLPACHSHEVQAEHIISPPGQQAAETGYI